MALGQEKGLMERQEYHLQGLKHHESTDEHHRHWWEQQNPLRSIQHPTPAIKQFPNYNKVNGS